MAQAVGGKLATVIGGSGFIGRYVVRALARRGYRIRAAVRRPDLAGHLQPMGTVGQIQAVQANVRYPQSVQRAVSGADLVVYLPAVLTNGRKQSFAALHVEGARCAAEAAHEAGATSFVHFSALGADAGAPSHYARSKAAGEVAVLEAFPDAVILRPSIVFGPEDDFFNRFAGMARYSPVLPLVGGGRTKFQPVYVGDLADAVTAVAQGQARAGTIYEIGGPEIFTFRELMDKVREFTQLDRGNLSLPFWLAKLQAALTKPLPDSLRPITVDQVRSLTVDNIVSKAAIEEGRTLAGLGVTQLESVDSIVPTYLARFRPRGQFASYRS